MSITGLFRCFIAEIYSSSSRDDIWRTSRFCISRWVTTVLCFLRLFCFLIPCGFTSFLILSGTPGLRLRPVLSVSCPPKADAPDAPESRSSRSIFDREEIIPVFGAYLPLHHTGYLVCVQAGVLADDALRVVKTPSVMREKLIRPFAQRALLHCSVTGEHVPTGSALMRSRLSMYRPSGSDIHVHEQMFGEISKEHMIPGYQGAADAVI